MPGRTLVEKKRPQLRSLAAALLAMQGKGEKNMAKRNYHMEKIAVRVCFESRANDG